MLDVNIWMSIFRCHFLIQTNPFPFQQQHPWPHICNATAATPNTAPQIHEPSRLQKPGMAQIIRWATTVTLLAASGSLPISSINEVKPHILTTPCPRGVLIQISSENYFVTSASMWLACFEKQMPTQLHLIVPKDQHHLHRTPPPSRAWKLSVTLRNVVRKSMKQHHKNASHLIPNLLLINKKTHQHTTTLRHKCTSLAQWLVEHQCDSCVLQVKQIHSYDKLCDRGPCLQYSQSNRINSKRC